jgi:guanylate kinase
MRLRVINGTPRHDVTLCVSCTNRKIRHGTRSADDYFGCEDFDGRIAQPVVECSRYHDGRLSAPAEMTKQAFRWVPSLGHFLSPVEWEMARVNQKLKGGDY